MTTKVFLSGSRKITRLNSLIRERLKTMEDKGFCIVVGDANGADKAMQSYFAETHYRKVRVFCAGTHCRNNLGEWTISSIGTEQHLKGRQFYEQKDKAMASEADYGFVLWDGKSTGTFRNILEMVKEKKPVVVYLSPKKEFHNVKTADDAGRLLAYGGESNYRTILRKLGKDELIEQLQVLTQRSLAL